MGLSVPSPQGLAPVRQDRPQPARFSGGHWQATSEKGRDQSHGRDPEAVAFPPTYMHSLDRHSLDIVCYNMEEY